MKPTVGVAIGSGCLLVALSIACKELQEYLRDDAGAGDPRSLIAIFSFLGVAAALCYDHYTRPPWVSTGKPVLAVDMDEVCCGYLPAFCDFSNAKYNTCLDVDDFTSYMFWEVKKARLKSREEAVERVYEFHASKYFRNIKPFGDTKTALDVLKKHFELHVVTSRQTDIEQQTRDFVDKHFPDCFTALHFGNHFGTSGAKVSKPEMCKKIRAVALIDDSKDYARQCAADGLPVFLFGNYPWNALQKGEAALDARITRVSCWRMAAHLISPQVVESMS